MTKTFKRRERKEKPAKKPVVRVEFLSSGSTLLNLAASGKGKTGGWARRRIVNIVGDGSSGKTLMALELCADAFYNLKDKDSTVKKLDIVYDNVEGVMDFPIEEMYGEDFVQGVTGLHEGAFERSRFCEDFGKRYINRVKKLKKGECLIYVIDSLDALDSKAGDKRVEEELNRPEDSKEKKKGTYDLDKPKYFSKTFFRKLCLEMDGKDKDATLIIISQVRDKIDAGIFDAEKQYRTGGKGMDFYTHQVAWLGGGKKLKKDYNKQVVIYGVQCRAKFKRNKTAKPFRVAEFDILFDHGVDEVGSVLDYMEIDKKKIPYYENHPEEFAELVGKAEEKWNKHEEGAKPKRKRRFGLE